MVEEVVTIEARKLGTNKDWEFKLDGTIPPFVSEAVREAKEAIGDMGEIKIEGDRVVGRIAGDLDKIVERLAKKSLGEILSGVPPTPSIKHGGVVKQAIQPYPRLSSAWVHENCMERLKPSIGEIPVKHKKHAVICEARFGACGYQDAAFGLTIELKSEDGLHSAWSFYAMVDISELMRRAKASSLKALVGKPMFVYIWGFNTVAGVDVNDALVIGE